MRNRLILGLFAGAALTLALTACGGSDDDKKESAATTAPQPTAAAQATTAPTAAAAATTAPTAAAQATTAAPQAIEIKAADFSYDPSTLNAKRGAIVITLTNNSEGNRPHTINVKNKDGSDMAKSERVAPGASGKLEFTINEPGTYEYYCSLPGHADRGQKGTLTVS